MDILTTMVTVANNIFDYYGKWYRLVDIYKILTASEPNEKIVVSILICVISLLVLFNKAADWRRQKNTEKAEHGIVIDEDDASIELIEVRGQQDN